MNKPDIAQVGSAFRFSWPEGIDIELDRFYDSRGDISAEATIHSKIPPNPGLIHHARLNLMSTQARATLSRQIALRLKGVDCAAMLEQLCYLAVDRYRCGDDPIDLRTIDPYKKPVWLLYPYLEYGGHTILYAEGEVGKSFVALWMGIQVSLGPRDWRGEPQAPKKVLYLDWETGGDTHAERLTAICAGMGIDKEAIPPMFYRHMDSTLPQAVDALRKWIDTSQIGMVIIDSLGMAGDGPPEEAATALSLARAITSLRVPALCIHHKRKQAPGMKGESQRDRLFGSVYYTNAARLVWELDGEKEDNSPSIDVAMVNVKRNNGPRLKRHALHLEFTNDDFEHLTCVKIKKLNIEDVAVFSEKVSLRDRILNELKRGSATAAELCDTLGVDRKQLQVRLSELKSKELVTKLADSDDWGLVSRETAPF